MIQQQVVNEYIIRKDWPVELSNQLIEPEADHCNKKLDTTNCSESRMLTDEFLT